jgi:cephalosporin hydroxylase
MDKIIVKYYNNDKVMNNFCKEIATKAKNEHWAAQNIEESAEFLTWLFNIEPKPKYIIEIGVYYGGNLWAMQQVVPEATYIGIEPNILKIKNNSFIPGTIILAGKSGDKKIQEIVKQIYKPEESLVFFDGSHDWKSVMRESKIYPAKYHVYHDVKDDRKTWKVAKMFYDNREQFIEVFSQEEHHGGIGIRIGTNSLKVIK